MDYKKIILDNITYHLINTKRFKQISIVSFFTKDYSLEDRKYANMLIGNLMYSSKKYNTRNKMTAYTEELYCSKVSGGFSLTGSSEAYSFILEFVNPKYTSEEYLKKTIDYYSEVLLNPNIEDDHFNDEYFNIIKNDIIVSIKSIKDNPNAYSSLKYNRVMYKGTPSAEGTIPTVKEEESITSSELYDYYKRLFDGSFKIDVCILGEVDENIIKLLHKKFKHIKSNNNKIALSIKPIYDGKITKEEDSLKYNQSKLYLGYKLIDMTDHELNHVLKIYNTILGTMNDSILFNVVRENNSLCYTIGSYTSKYNPSLTIYAGINKENYEKTVSLIKECVSSMSNRKEVGRLFESAKKTYNTYLNGYYDDAFGQINHYYVNEFESIEDVETQRKNINNVTIDEVLKLNEKIKLDTIYFLKGDKE